MRLSPKRVIMPVYSYYPWDPRVRREAEALLDAGYHVDVICLRDRKEKAFTHSEHLRVYRIPMKVKRGGALRYLYQYGRFLLHSGYKVADLFYSRRHAFVHVHTLPDFEVFAALVPWMFGARVILDMHEMMPELFAARFGVKKGSFKFRVARLLEEASIAFADEVLTATDSYKEAFVSRKAPESKITVVMNSPRVSSTDLSEDAGKLLDSLGCNVPELVVYAGGLNAERDLMTLLDAWKLVAKKKPSARLALFGHGEDWYVYHLKQRASENVVFGGSVESPLVLPLLAKSQIGIVTYERNPLTERALPTKVFEYAHLGKSMVVADLPEMRRVLGDGALYYTPGDAGDLAEKMLSLMDSPSRFSDETRKALEPYAWEHQEKKLLAVYEKLSRELKH